MRKKYEQIWDVIKNKLSIKFHLKPIYDQKYLKTKVREYDDVIKTNISGNDSPKENIHYNCIVCITIDCYENGKEKFSTSLFRRV